MTAKKGNRFLVFTLKLFIYAAILTVLSSRDSFSQLHQPNPLQQHILDSIDNQILIYQNKLESQKTRQDAGYYYSRRELDILLFARQFEEYIIDEELDMARDLVVKRMEKSKFRSDKYSYNAYSEYKERLNNEFRMHRLKYQRLLEDEKSFRKKLFGYLKENTSTSFLIARQMTELAQKYARENNYENSIVYLNYYHGYINAMELDFNTEYDLKKMTKSKKYFHSYYNPLVEADSLNKIEEAEILIEQCFQYTRYTNGNLDTTFFMQERKLVATALSDYFDRHGNDNELSSYLDQAVVARRDSLNQYGVFKWHKFIVVISNMEHSSGSPLIKKGEAIIDADRKLMKYLRVNKLGTIEDGDKMGNTFVIPYATKNGNENFIFDREQRKWQYMICYTRIKTQEFTQEVSKYLPPLLFNDEITETAMQEQNKNNFPE